jgi:hypothetical protein
MQSLASGYESPEHSEDDEDDEEPEDEVGRTKGKSARLLGRSVAEAQSPRKRTRASEGARRPGRKPGAKSRLPELVEKASLQLEQEVCKLCEEEAALLENENLRRHKVLQLVHENPSGPWFINSLGTTDATRAKGPSLEQLERLMRQVPLLRRDYIESFLRPKELDERACSFGQGCLGLQLNLVPAQMRFVLCEFRLPQEQDLYSLRKGGAQFAARPCVLCTAMITLDVVAGLQNSCMQAKDVAVCMIFGVYAGVEGEYPIHDCWKPENNFGNIPSALFFPALNRFEMRVVAGKMKLIDLSPRPTLANEPEPSVRGTTRQQPQPQSKPPPQPQHRQRANAASKNRQDF